eukprot:scaffold130831_cov48-Phaeocystis_antarctica.AAC.1
MGQDSLKRWARVRFGCVHGGWLDGKPLDGKPLEKLCKVRACNTVLHSHANGDLFFHSPPANSLHGLKVRSAFGGVTGVGVGGGFGGALIDAAAEQVAQRGE